jgi:hypothetical protein
MRPTTIYEDQEFSLTGYGGVALSFERTHGANTVSLFMQGDDALQFFCEAELYRDTFPDKPEREVIQYLWDNHYFGE